MTTPNLDMPEMTHQEYNGEVTHNEAIQILDLHAQAIVVTHAQATEPGSPNEGDAYIISSAWGDGVAKQIAHYYNSTWHYYTPEEGWKCLSKVDDNYYVYDGSAWGLYNDASILIHDMASDADYTLSISTTPQEWQYQIIKITDTSTNLTTGRNIIVPDNIKQYVFLNVTAQTLTMKTSAGSGVAVVTNKNAILLCDGTNVIRLSQDS